MLAPDLIRLIAITDDLRDGVDGLVARSVAVVRGGATMVQLRLKDLPARELVPIARQLIAALPVPVLVNDRADVALVAGAAGVHVGPDDLPVQALRPLVPRGFIIGASFGTLEELEHAKGADYVGIGPWSVTASKADAGDALGQTGFAALRARMPCPAVAIGGIDEHSAPAAIAAGADGVAVIRAAFASADPERAARGLRRAIGS